MANLEKIARLAEGSKYDVVRPEMDSGESLDLEKVNVLGEGTKHDVCASTATPRAVNSLDRIGSVSSAGICHSFTPDGRCVSLFKTLYTNGCSQDCGYCPNSASCAGRDKTLSYTPEELAKVTLSLYQSNYVEGLFLSSGMGKDEDTIMEALIESVRLLREDYKFEGYVHLKILPGTSKDYIKRCLKLVDRVSLNIETCSESRMRELTSTKDYRYDILRRQRYIRDFSKRIGLPAGHTTQTIVGASGESDKEIFESMLREYRRMKVRRMYFSSFTPVKRTRFEKKECVPRKREHRLYQTDWLFRIYGFEPREICAAFDDNGFLPEIDPKLEIARYLFHEAVDPNDAPYDTLIRVPGIGPKGASRIVKARKEKKITKRRELAKFGVVLKRARPFLKLNGWEDATLDRWLT
ncbi:MAG: radical SAM protein [Thermoplasmata archaeon]